ncbi:MAG TPA: Mur ligase domain-containing protein, partial [Patescibacteria group bacterium]|nr:Mur ligase domain-containing protein [Patescibacteria group bacterium]
MMQPFSDYHSIHLVGIKGVALTALACCLHDLGKQIEGSDVEEDFVTKEQLDRLHVKVYTTFSPENLHASTDLVIFSGAHKGSENPIVVAAKEKGIRCLTHAEALGILMQGKIGISACGVGGKTSTSAMIAWILEHAGLHPSFAVGVGNIPNLGVPGRFDKVSQYFVAEADEYVSDPGHDATPRFMFQYPTVIVCTNLEFDHPDVYPSFDDVMKAYLAFFHQLSDGGTLVYNAENDELDTLVKGFVKTREDLGKKVNVVPVSSADSAWG